MWRRASTYSHLQVLCTQNGIIDLDARIVRDKANRKQLLTLFDNKELKMMISLDLMFMEFLDPLIADLEGHVRRQAKYHNHLDYQILRSIPGAGEILSLIILYETHDIKRIANF